MFERLLPRALIGAWLLAIVCLVTLVPVPAASGAEGSSAPTRQETQTPAVQSEETQIPGPTVSSPGAVSRPDPESSHAVLAPAPPGQARTNPAPVPSPSDKGMSSPLLPSPSPLTAPLRPAKDSPSPSSLLPQRPQAQSGQPALAPDLPGTALTQTGMAGRAGGRGSFSLNFDDADVFSVTQTVFGEILRVNYVVDPRIKGRVTFRSVAPISRDQVLPVMEVILRLNGIGVVEDSGLYRIVPLSEVSREPSPISFGNDPDQLPTTGKSIVHVVPVTFLQSGEVVKLITPFLSANAVVLDVPKSNQVIIVDTDASVKRILQLIRTFDNEKQKKKRAQVFVYPVQNGKARDIAGLLQRIFLGPKSSALPADGQRPATGAAPAGSGNQALPMSSSSAQASQPATGPAAQQTLVADITRIFSDDIINSVIVLATPEDYETIKETIARIDIVPRQVVIEGVVASLNLTDSLSLGLAYSVKAKFSFRSGEALTSDIALNPGSISGLDPTSLSASGFTFVGTDNRGVVRAYVNALASESKAKLLAAPHILVSDNREARIQVGQQVPIVTSETFGSTTVAPQRTIQYKDIGIILKVKPQVNESGLVALDLSQEVSTFETIVLFSNEKQIILNKAEATTNLVVQDGQTVIIGGLIREDKSGSKSGIPLLSSIPLLGGLFGSRSNEVRRQEIIILLTPHVIKNQREAQHITSEYIDNITNGGSGKAGLSREEVVKSGVQIRKGAGTPLPDEGKSNGR
ncbi:MAG: Type II secretion system protein D precursor [Syntrophorhabdaceae bacterium PtaU1.Bin034]|nr:MAG: Type II secretion system protein D precursor [Syntrophorhabdaceae bacterium PtaU1.Bin034]